MTFEKLFKAVPILWVRKVVLPELRPTQTPPVNTLDGRFAYFCKDDRCQTVSASAPRGVCEKCGRNCIVPVQDLIGASVQVTAMRAQLRHTEKAHRAMRAIKANPSSYLTEFRTPEETPAGASSGRRRH